METFYVCCLFILATAHQSLAVPRVPQGLLHYSDLRGSGGYSVSYDERSFIVNGSRTLFLSGSVHYPRSTPGMWDDILQAMRDDGLNMVELYLFWNLHEFRRGQLYDLSGSANWPLFVEKAAAKGLFVNFRIGPYVCAEWNYGGLPVWLNFIPGLQIRMDNEPWKTEMARFVRDMVALATPYLAKNGGPIVMAQIENEYRWNYPSYITWVGKLVASLNIGVPWIMCNGDSANDTVNTCNGNDCTSYAESHHTKFPGQPLAWTENEGWFQEWSVEPLLPSRDDRTPEDISYTILRWFARGGAHHNYYMWFGGNHMARWAASDLTNKYADGVNFHSDFQPNEPKKTHLHRLHELLGGYSSVLLGSPSQINNQQTVLVLNTSSGQYVNATKQYAFVYGSKVAFIENDDSVQAEVKFMRNAYTLPRSSVSIVDVGSGKELYSSGKVNSTGVPTQRVYKVLMEKLSWVAWQEDVCKLEGGFNATHPVEQLYITRDETEYLFYQTAVASDTTGPVQLVVNAQKAGALFAYIDGEYQSTAYDAEHSFQSMPYKLTLNISDSNTHQLTLLSVSLGILNAFNPGQFVIKGITGNVLLGSQDITERQWLHRAKLQGEILQVFTTQGARSVTWNSNWQKYTLKSLVWFQLSFPKPSVPQGYSLLLDLSGMGRGHIYLNGEDLGRFWLVKVNGVVVQQYYFVPPDLLQESNLLTLVEETGAPDPSLVRIVASTMVVPQY